MMDEDIPVIDVRNQRQIEVGGHGLAEDATESIIVYAPDHTILYWNPASELLYGWLKSEVVGRKAEDVAFTNFGGDHLATLFQEGQWEGLLQRRSPLGGHTLARVRMVVRRDARGEVSSVVEYGVSAGAESPNVPPQRYADWAAVWSIDASRLSACIIERSGLFSPHESSGTALPLEEIAASMKIIDVNETAVRLFGRSIQADAIKGRRIADYWPRKHCHGLISTVLQLVGDSHTASGGVIRRKEENIVLAVWRNDAAPDVIFASITGSWSNPQSYWELEASEERYRSLIHNIPVAVWQVDARVMSDVVGRMRHEGVTNIGDYLKTHPELASFASDAVVVNEVNERAIRLLNGKSRSQLIQSVRYLFEATPQAAFRVVEAHFDGRRNHVEEMKVRGFDGQVIDVLFFVTFPKPPESLDTTLIMMLDITERRRMERQLKQMETDFAHAARVSTLGELVTSIAHEVNQPLSVIVTDGDTGLRWLGRSDPNLPKVRQLVTRIVENAHRADRVLQRIKDTAAKKEPRKQALDLNDIIREALLFIETEAEARSISIRPQLARNLPTTFGDRVQLQQVVVNLLVNSMHAIASGDSVLREIVLATAAEDETTISMVVRDSGGGIAPEDVDKLFEGFFSTKEGGMGMGLAICRSIVMDHGGQIRVLSNADTGAAFEVLLPRAHSAGVMPHPIVHTNV
jgi:signal transduction histidine kinase